MECDVKLVRDIETGWWYTESDSMPGMVLESYSVDVLMEKVRGVAPDMYEIEHNYTGPITFRFKLECEETIREAS